jgi:hypothetical protein
VAEPRQPRPPATPRRVRRGLGAGAHRLRRTGRPPRRRQLSLDPPIVAVRSIPGSWRRRTSTACIEGTGSGGVVLGRGATGRLELGPDPGRGGDASPCEADVSVRVTVASIGEASGGITFPERRCSPARGTLCRQERHNVPEGRANPRLWNVMPPRGRRDDEAGAPHRQEPPLTQPQLTYAGAAGPGAPSPTGGPR